MFHLNCGEIRTAILARLTSWGTSIDNRAEDRVEDQPEPEIDEKDVAQRQIAGVLRACMMFFHRGFRAFREMLASSGIMSNRSQMVAIARQNARGESSGNRSRARALA
jgi:hypothetical protein